MLFIQSLNICNWTSYQTEKKSVMIWIQILNGSHLEMQTLVSESYILFTSSVYFIDVLYHMPYLDNRYFCLCVHTLHVSALPWTLSIKVWLHEVLHFPSAFQLCALFGLLVVQVTSHFWIVFSPSVLPANNISLIYQYFIDVTIQNITPGHWAFYYSIISYTIYFNIT